MIDSVFQPPNGGKNREEREMWQNALFATTLFQWV